LGISYTSDDYVECFIGRSRSDSNNEKGSEDEIAARYDEKKIRGNSIKKSEIGGAKEEATK
jgi:hypothetical protein